jgi:hypothetical protein
MPTNICLSAGPAGSWRYVRSDAAEGIIVTACVRAATPLRDSLESNRHV